MFVFNVILFVEIIRCAVVTVDAAIELQTEPEGMQITPGASDGDAVTQDIIVEFPFLVGLTSDRADDNPVVCTGTLVSPSFVLSSAHCLSRLRTMLEAYRKVSVNALEYRGITNVYVHPSYDSANRVADLSVAKLERPFHHINHFTRLSTKKAFQNDEMDCAVIGIGSPYGPGYKVPVQVRYAQNACHILETGLRINFVMPYTWAEFLCAKTFGTPKLLPCDRGDPLLCRDGKQYGLLSYAYSTTKSSQVAELYDCGDPTVQSKHLFLNRYARWIQDTIRRPGYGDREGSRPPENRRIPVISTTPPQTSTSKFVATTAAADVSFDPENYPYVVYLEGYPDEPTCGGTMLSPVHVLTSAYCTTRMSTIEVYLLTKTDKHHSNASFVFVHPDFDQSNLTADISIVVLSEPLNVSRYSQLVDHSNPIDDNITVTLTCVVVAKRRPMPYRYAPVKVKYGPRACRKAFNVEIQVSVNKTWREFICGTSKNRFNRIHQSVNQFSDLGDPLICDGLQYGITSHSYRTRRAGNRTDADQIRFLGVSNYRQWIDEVMATKGTATRSRTSTIIGRLVLAGLTFLMCLYRL